MIKNSITIHITKNVYNEIKWAIDRDSDQISDEEMVGILDSIKFKLLMGIHAVKTEEEDY